MAMLDRVSAQAREAEFHPGRALLTLIAGVLYGLGWLAARAWLAVGWSVAAVRLGWQEGRKEPAQARAAPRA